MEHKQKQVFIKIISTKSSIQSLAGFVQNDIGSMLDDGYISRDNLKSMVVDAEIQFLEVIKDLYVLKNEVIAIINNHLNKEK